MKIIDILNKKNMSLSFEVFPPKKESTFESVVEATEKIAASHPAFMSVTYGAGGGTSKYTLEIARNIKDKYKKKTGVKICPVQVLNILFSHKNNFENLNLLRQF